VRTVTALVAIAIGVVLAVMAYVSVTHPRGRPPFVEERS
jgi:hypothetical protein